MLVVRMKRGLWGRKRQEPGLPEAPGEPALPEPF